MQDLRRALMQELSVVQVGMLGVRGTPLPFRPMAHLMASGDTGAPEALWFLAEADTDLVRAAEVPGAEAWYCLTGRAHDRYACLGGPIRCIPDRQGLERVWSITAEVIFPGGLADIEWMPLRMDLHEADVWAEPQSAILAGMDVIATALQDERPAERVHQRIVF